MEESRIAQMKKDDPAMVAKEAFEALQKGRDHVITGLKNKVVVGTTNAAPEPFKAEMNRKMNEPKEGEA
jgi:short-subunit dehydrogenase